MEKSIPIVGTAGWMNSFTLSNMLRRYYTHSNLTRVLVTAPAPIKQASLYWTLQPPHIPMRAYATWKNLPTNSGENAINKSITQGPKVITTATNITYVLYFIIVLGVAVALVIVMITTLLDSFGERAIFDKCMSQISNNNEVVSMLGAPLRGIGPGRHNSFKYAKFVDEEGTTRINASFTLKGQLKKARVHSQLEKINSFECKFVFLILEVGEKRRRLVIIDDRPKHKSTRRGFGIFGKKSSDE